MQGWSPLRSAFANWEGYAVSATSQDSQQALRLFLKVIQALLVQLLHVNLMGYEHIKSSLRHALHKSFKCEQLLSI